MAGTGLVRRSTGRPALLVLTVGLFILPVSLCGSADASAAKGGQIESDSAAKQAPGGAKLDSSTMRFPRVFNAQTMRIVGKEDIVSSSYAAFIPAARPAYDARMDSSLPLARRINKGYR